MIHQQPTLRTAHDHNGEIIGYFERTRHTALDAPCPHCDARIGGRCQRKSGALLPARSVHLARQEASL
jgi:hypothetical protein